MTPAELKAYYARKYSPYLKLKRNRKWSATVAWDFFTLRNSLAITVCTRVARKKDAVAIAQQFIDRNGLSPLFSASYFKFKKS